MFSARSKYPLPVTVTWELFDQLCTTSAEFLDIDAEISLSTASGFEFKTSNYKDLANDLDIKNDKIIEIKITGFNYSTKNSLYLNIQNSFYAKSILFSANGEKESVITFMRNVEKIFQINEPIYGLFYNKYFKILVFLSALVILSSPFVELLFEYNREGRVVFERSSSIFILIYTFFSPYFANNIKNFIYQICFPIVEIKIGKQNFYKKTSAYLTGTLFGLIALGVFVNILTDLIKYLMVQK